MTMLIRGSCHCGNIRFEVQWPDSTDPIGVRACGCDFCQKHGGVWTSHPHASLDVFVEDPGRVSHYRFGTRTAEFHVCADCGVPPVVTSEIDGEVYAVVNSNTSSPSKSESERDSSNSFVLSNVFELTTA